MWRWILVNLLTLSYTSTQPISDHDGRPLECCPCPKPADMATLATTRSSFADDCPCRASVLISNPEGGFTRFGDGDQTLAGSAGDGMFVRAGGVDDCPCRFRDADSVGAPSVFFPSAVRALWPGVSDKESKEDIKPLLHPEVGLASSVLETLREATDEEYHEALARDAVKSVLEAPDVEVMSDVSSALDTARDIVNVLLKPSNIESESRDDNNSEASHVQESRCIHPLGRSKGLNFKISPAVVDEVYTIPQKKPVTLVHKSNIWDMDSSVGASNVHEEIIDDTEGTGEKMDTLKLNTNPSLFKLFPGKSNDKPIQNKFKTIENRRKLTNNFKEADKSRNPLDDINTHINNSLLDLKLKLDNHLQSINNDNAERLKNVFDSVSSSSVPNLVIKPLFPTTKLDITTVKPFPLKSLLKLKDVELVPPVQSSTSDLNKAKVNIPKLIPPVHKNQDSGVDLFKHFKATDLGDLITNGLKISFKNINNQGGTESIQPIPKVIFKSNIVDAETSPSEIKTNISKGTRSSGDCVNNINNVSLQNQDSAQLPKAKHTEIIENVPKPTEIIKENIKYSEAKAECQEELENNNINDLSNNDIKIPNTDIIDTVPSPSQVQPVEIINGNKDAEREDFNEISRDEAECQADITTEEDENSPFSNEANPNDENIDDFETDQGDNDELNNLSDPESETREHEENCSLIEQDSAPAASDDSPHVFKAENEQLSDITSTKSHTSSNEACSEERESELDLELKSNPFFKKGTHFILDEEKKLGTLDKLEKPKFKSEENIPEKVVCGEENSIPSKSVHNGQLENNPLKTLGIQDLQNMSDKLLDLSTKKDQEISASENINCISEALENANSSEDEIIERFDDSVSTENKNSAEFNKFLENNHSNNKPFEKELTCSSDIDRQSNSIFKSNTKSEMTADGSDPFIDKVSPESEYKPSLLHNILHPKVQNIGNNLGGSSLAINDKINLKLPSLDDVRENLARILEPKDSFDLFNIEKERLIGDSNTMSVEASAPSFKSVFPTLHSSEDIDLDIFQLRPLSLPGPQDLLSKLPSLPQLNLNSYKAKLAIPKGFNFKPMKLESSLGGKNGLLGATLTVGANKGSFGQGSNLFGDPLGLSNLPTLEELHSNIRENTQNLLFTPIDITGRNILDDSLRSTQTLTDNIRSQAKNTVKDIQQTLETTLKDVKQSDLGILADPLKDPKEFLEAVSRTHEDVTDKLKAIHYDFNDRLESLRDRITDQSLLPTLNVPMIRQSSLTFGPEKIKEKDFYRNPQKKLKAAGKKSNHQNNLRISSNRRKPVKGTNKKISAAPSIPVPKTVEAPKLKTIVTSSPPPFVIKYLRTPQFLNNKTPMKDLFQESISQFKDSKIPVLGKYKPIENKVKISFGSTTLKPDLFRNKPNLASRPSPTRKPISSIKITNPIKNSAPRIGSKLRPSDANGAPSGMASAKLKLPVVNEKIESDRPITKTVPATPLKSKSLLNKSNQQNVDDRFTNGHSGSQFSSFDQSPLRSQSETISNSRMMGSPKNVDVLSSLREAVRARLSNLTPLPNDKIVQPDTSTNESDMFRSASENVVSTDSLMRENVSYTCKMMCTRNN